MYVRRSVTVAAVVGALTLSACGASSGDPAAQVVATPVPEAPAIDTTAPPDTTASSDTTAPPDTTASSESPPASVADDAPAASSAQSDPTPETAEAPATAAPTTDAPTAGPAPAEIGGRAFADTLLTTSDTASNPLPDLVVDDIRRSTKVNLRNVFPADRPVLIWMWAPH